MASHNTASRQVALDHILRRLIKQNLRHGSNVQLWNSICRLIPGVTVKQCMQRWVELCEEAGYSEMEGKSLLEATGRPVSSHPRIGPAHYPPRGGASGRVVRSKSSSSVPTPSSRPLSRAGPGTGEGAGLEREGAGLEREGEGLEREEQGQPEETIPAAGVSVPSSTSFPQATPPPATPPSKEHLTINVCDNVRNVKEVFLCECELLVREMGYFGQYLLSYPRQEWSKADISVHCDVAVFTWLMRYVKRGSFEDPFGHCMEAEQGKPEITAGYVVSILISSEFLKMARLVEECLDYLHDNVTAVLSSRVSLSCLSESVLQRLAARFSPEALEALPDKKDKLRNKLYSKKLFELFSPDHTPSHCHGSAATLYRCLYCNQMLTSSQEWVIPCSPERLAMGKNGEVWYRHHGDPDWEVNAYLQQLVQQGKSARELYWMIWGVVNSLVCQQCGQTFQCRDLPNCWSHPQPAKPKRPGFKQLLHQCCGQPSGHYTILPFRETGCTRCDHQPKEDGRQESGSSSPTLLSLTIAHRSLVCVDRYDRLPSNRSDCCFLQHLLAPPSTYRGWSQALRPVRGGPTWDLTKSFRWNLDCQRQQDQQDMEKLRKLLSTSASMQAK